MSARLWLSLCTALLASGCTFLDLDSPRRYACDADAGAGAGQCAPGSVCGLEGFCHPEGEERAWRCTDDSHCEGPWRCGLEGVCHRIGDEQPWQCADDSHCEGAWRCGPDGSCLDPSAEALVSAPLAAVNATAASTPLPRGLPAAVAGNREGFSVRHPTCSIYVDEYDGGYLYAWDHGQSSTVISDGGVYKLIEWGDRFVRPDGGFPLATDCDGGSGIPIQQRTFETLHATIEGQPLAAYERERSTWVLLDGGTLCRFEITDQLTLERDCGFAFSAARPPSTLRGAWEAPPLVLGLGEDHYQLLDLETGTAGPVSEVFGEEDSPLRIHDLVAYGASPTYLLAATPRGAFVRALDGSPVGDAGIVHRDGWQPVRLDPFWNIPCEPVRRGYYYEGVPRRFAISTDDEGQLHLQVLVRLGHAEDGGFTERLVLLETREDDGGWPAYDECQHLPAPSRDRYFVESKRTCEICPVNSPTRWFRARAESPFEGAPPAGVPVPEHPVKLEARCINPDGGADIVALDPTGTCNPHDGKGDNFASAFGAPPTGGRFERPTAADSVSLADTTVMDDLGHVWRTGYAWEFIPWFLDRAPDFAFQWSGPFSVGYPAQTHGRLFEYSAVVSPPRSFDETASGFLASELGDVPMEATVRGHPRLVVVNFNGPDATPVIGLFELLSENSRPGEVQVRVHARVPSESVFGSPFHAELASSSTGRQILVISSFDTVLAADITASMTAPVPLTPFDFDEFFTSIEPQVKFTAVLRTPVQSMVTLAAPTGTGAEPRYVEGYLLQASRVFRFRAPNINVWRTEEIILQDETEPLAVFADGVRGRVGMKNGRIYSLPTRFSLANELPASAQPASGFHAWCGHVVAVARDGVYRLASGAGPLADWVRLPLPEGDFEGARVFGTPEALRVFSSAGDAWRVTGFECRAPAQ